MDKFLLLIRAVFSGLLTGLLVSIPLGPAGLESIKRTISRGYKEGFMVSLGAISGDTLDIVLINFGLYNLLSGHKRTEAVFWIISGTVLTIIGYLSVKGDERVKKLETDPDVIKNKKLRSMPFIVGFLIVVSNPLTHSLWFTMSGTVIRVWHYRGALPYYIFIASIVAGMIIWFSLLNFLVLKGHKKLSISSSNKISTVLMWVILIVGIVFIIFGTYTLIFV